MKIKSTVNLVIGVVLLCIVAAPALAQPVLTLEGSCPGEMRAEVRGARPNDGISLLFSPREGRFRIPVPRFCQGVVLGLAWRGIRYAADSTITDETGFAYFEGQVNPGGCGGFLQALDRACQPSNVVQIQ